MNKVHFALVGCGWRAEFYMRVAKAMPETFEICGIYDKDQKKAKEAEEKWGIKSYGSITDLIKKTDPEFISVVIPRDFTLPVVKEIAAKSVPLILETPPAAKIENMIEFYNLTSKGAKIQVSEQYQFQPYNAAALAVVKSGKLGKVTQAQVSVAHGYHGISLMRLLLGIKFEDVAITGYSFASKIVAGPGRSGPPTEEALVGTRQIIARFDFGDKTGVYDFTDDQYFSWIRSQRLLVRGERGEINNDDVRYLKDFLTPIHVRMNRVNAGEDGNLEGFSIKGILLGDEWVYKNPFFSARLSGDEIAVAACLQKMREYVNGGPSFYSLAEAAQDRYLEILLTEAIKTGKTARSTRQPWAQL